VPTVSALNPCPRSIQVGEFEVAKGGGVWVAVRVNRLASGEVVLLLVYAKAKFDNLRPEFLLQLRERFNGKD